MKLRGFEIASHFNYLQVLVFYESKNMKKWLVNVLTEAFKIY